MPRDGNCLTIILLLLLTPIIFFLLSRDGNCLAILLLRLLTPIICKHRNNSILFNVLNYFNISDIYYTRFINIAIIVFSLTFLTILTSQTSIIQFFLLSRDGNCLAILLLRLLTPIIYKVHHNSILFNVFNYFNISDIYYKIFIKFTIIVFSLTFLSILTFQTPIIQYFLLPRDGNC